MTTQTFSAAAGLSGLVKGTLQHTEQCIAGVPEDKRYHSIKEGKASPLWLIGHLAATTSYLGCVLTLGQEAAVPADWMRTFGPTEFGGKPITNKPEDYPSWDEVVAAYKKAMTAFAEGVAKLDDADLPGACKGQVPPPLQKMLPNIMGGIGLVVIHDGHHCGQVGLIAKS